MNHWDALEGFQKLRNDYFPSARNQHIIYFIGRLWKDARTEKWYQEAVKSIHQNIKEHPDIFGEVLSDLEKIKSTLDDNSVSELEALKKQLEVNINIPILPFVPKTHQIIKEYQTDIRVSVDYAGIHKVEYRMFSYMALTNKGFLWMKSGDEGQDLAKEINELFERFKKNEHDFNELNYTLYHYKIEDDKFHIIGYPNKEDLEYFDILEDGGLKDNRNKLIYKLIVENK